MDSKFSIAIPAYEMRGYGAEYLEELFESIFKQTYPNQESLQVNYKAYLKQF